MKYEYCCNCSEPTGKAGAGDDSLYTDNDGPFCEDCFPDKERPQRTWVGLTEEDIDDAEIHLTSCRNNHESWIEGIQEFAQAIEAKLKEKNT